MAPDLANLVGQKLPWTKIKIADYASVPSDSATSPGRASTDEGSEDGLLEKVGQGGRRERHLEPRKPLWKNWRFIVAHGALFLVYIVTLLWVVNSKWRAGRNSGLPSSPAVDVLTYQETSFSLEDRIYHNAGIYAGEPSPELDKAWHDLLDIQNLVVEPEYIKHYNRESTAVEVPEGGGYIVTLSVYHELHCLKRIHQFMYSEVYFPNLTQHEHDLNRLHNEHCIDFLRQSAMCHGDVGLMTYDWLPEYQLPVVNATTHQCVNWPNLEGWVRSRSVDMMKPGWLVHPTRGPAYPEGEGDQLGFALKHPHDGH